MLRMADYEWFDTVSYVLYTEEQGMVCECEVEISCDSYMDEEEIIEAIREDLLTRVEDWPDDKIWGIYEGEEIYPDEILW